MRQFSTKHVSLDGGVTIFVKYGGSGPGLLLLHGFPETHEMWRELAADLAQDYTVVMADLRGYGSSNCPPSDENHLAYSKRAMAADMVAVMRQLGFERFDVGGHDRGGRVAYRLALDYPEVVSRLVVLDIMPIAIAWEKADDRAMLGFWPWSLLAQVPPLPEKILQTNAAGIVNNACDSWGSPSQTFPPAIRQQYTSFLQEPETARAICEEYRAAATIDREHDEADQHAGHTITCPTLLLWSKDGPIDLWYKDEGGPLSLWKQLAPLVTGQTIAGGHFFPEANPKETLQHLRNFFASHSL